MLQNCDEASKCSVYLWVPTAVGFFAASWFALIQDGHGGKDFVFTPWGLVSGIIVEAAMYLNLTIGFPVLGIAVCSGIAAATNIASSLFVSVVVLGEEVENLALTITGILLAIIGLSGLTYTGLHFGTVREEPVSDTRERTTLLNSGETGSAVGGPEGKPRYFLGVAASVAIGLIGGFQLLPNQSCCADDGTMFFPSMGIGVLVFSPLFSLAMLPFFPDTKAQPLRPDWSTMREAAPVTLMGGAMNAGGILLTIKSMQLIDYVVAMVN